MGYAACREVPKSFSTLPENGEVGPAVSSLGIVQVKITGFSEDDQTNLYNMAHDASGKGRQGLGIASRPKKVLPFVMEGVFHTRGRAVLQSQWH